jgi:hypothetical protein
MTQAVQRGLIDSNLQEVLQHFAEEKEKAYDYRIANGEAVPWFRAPLGQWNGDLQTENGLKGIHRSYNTDKAESALITTYDPGAPGNSADGILLSLQIDYMAQAERAFRARTTQSFPRALAHLAAREQGHGSKTGAFLGQALDYFTLLLKQGGGGS